MNATRKPIRVLCVDDHAFLVEGLKSRFAMERDIIFAGRLATADHLADEAIRHEADVVLLDIEMPGPDPFSEMEDLHRRRPGVRTIVFSAFVRDRYIDEAVNRGAWGYLSKSDSPEQVIDAIRKVSRGETAFSPTVYQRVAGGEAKPTSTGRPAPRALHTVHSDDSSRPTSRLDRLTPREIEVLRMIGRGLSRIDIAKATHRSAKTIDNHRASIMEKLQIHDRVELARFAIREGLTEA